MMERWILKKDELADNVPRCPDIFLEVGKECGMIIDVAITKDEKMIGWFSQREMPASRERGEKAPQAQESGCHPRDRELQ